MRSEASPYRKAAAMVPLRFRGIPRRSRVLAIAVFCACLWLLLPRSDLGLGKTLAFFLFGPDVAGPYGPAPPKVDILKYIDPLIGTTNGGLYSFLAIIIVADGLADISQGHVFPGASLPYGNSSRL